MLLQPASPSLFLKAGHSEKFRMARPSFTSRCTSHEAGAMLAYAGHTVSLL
jgi:hypothetical protein